MIQPETSAVFMRRKEDLPLLILSQDYELFFGDSGTAEKCLFEPTDLLLDFARKHNARITFFVDAGMLVAMKRESNGADSICKERDRIRRHIELIANAGHEIALHVHPHWEDTRRSDGRWDFSGTRYRLDEFPVENIREIISSYCEELNELCQGQVTTYRAGGFCVEPFGLIGRHLLEAGITVDSSVVPGAVLRDGDKGFSFRGAPLSGWWQFSESPSVPDDTGEFLEIPITPLVLSPYHYWTRLFERLTGRRTTDQIGDGSSKAIGSVEILRRLAGFGRVSELSIDAPKASYLASTRVRREERTVWHVMGHPKLLGRSSLRSLELFIDRKDIRRIESVAALAESIRGA